MTTNEAILEAQLRLTRQFARDIESVTLNAGLNVVGMLVRFEELFQEFDKDWHTAAYGPAKSAGGPERVG